MGTFAEESHAKPSRESVVPTPQEYRGLAIDSKRIPIETIQTHITGRRYICDYYSHNYGRDNEISGNRQNASSVYQSSKLIRDFELKVTDPLPFNPSPNSTNQEMEVRGRTNIYPSIIPNPGDEFIATLRDGRQGVFTVVEPVTPLSVYSLTAYSFDFVLKDFLTPEYLNDLNRKVTRTYVFIRDNIGTGLNPVITEEAYADYTTLLEIRDNFPAMYLNRFYSNEYRTLVVPGQTNGTYDPFHTEFCANLFGSVDTGNINILGTLSISNNLPHNILTIHDLILGLKAGNFNQLTTKLQLISRSAFINSPVLMGARYCPLPLIVFTDHSSPNYYSGVVYPGIGDQVMKVCKYKFNSGKYHRYNFPVNIETLLPENKEYIIGLADDYRDLPDYKGVACDDFYIFSQDFYSRNRGSWSNVEKLVFDMLDQEMVDPKELIRLINESDTWSDVEGFYYQPFLYAMIHFAMRGLE